MTTVKNTEKKRPEKPLIIALHCSGGSPDHWSKLANHMQSETELFCPKQLCTNPELRNNRKRFYTLYDEAKPIVERIRMHQKPVYLVGHSFGGALALRVAQECPDQVTGITLYEPCVFGLLGQIGTAASPALSEIRHLQNRVCINLENGDRAMAMKYFIDYWNGSGAWSRMHEKAQQNLIDWAPNAYAHFATLFDYCVTPRLLRNLSMPVSIVIGDHARQPTWLIATELQNRLCHTKMQSITGAGHMGPVTHASILSQIIRKHYRYSITSGCTDGIHHRSENRQQKRIAA